MNPPASDPRLAALASLYAAAKAAVGPGSISFWIGSMEVYFGGDLTDPAYVAEAEAYIEILATRPEARQPSPAALGSFQP